MAKKLFAAAFFLITATCAFAVTQPASDSPAAPVAAKLPEGRVTLDGKPLFTVTERVLSFAPVDRARAITNRLTRLVKDPLIRIDSITAVDGDSTTDIVVGDTVIMTVTDSDAKAEGRPRKELAEEIARKIRTGLVMHNREYSMQELLFGGLYAFAASAVLILLIVLINRYYPRLAAKIESWRGTRIR